MHAKYEYMSAVYVLYGIPQETVLSLLLFILYRADMRTIIKDVRLTSHSYADDG